MAQTQVNIRTDFMLVICRSLLALIFLIVGLNDYHGLLKLPHVSVEGAEFIHALQNTGYLFWIVKVVEVTAALLLIGGILVPLATLAVFPIILNILLFHIFMDPGWGTVIALGMVACSGYIFYAYRSMFRFLWRYNMDIDPNSFGKRAQIPSARKKVKEVAASAKSG